MLLEDLKAYLKTDLVILGLGNTLRADDAAGVILARNLKKKLNYHVFEVGVALENYLEKIIEKRPHTLLIIDALDFGGSPGEIKIFNSKDLNKVHLGFTHNPSLFLAIKYLQTKLDINIIILAIQPKRLDFRKRMSKEVTTSLKMIEGFFIRNGQEIK